MSVTMSATLAANEAIARKRRSGTPVLPMAFGEAGLPVHPALGDALAASAGRNAYGPVAGSADLRGAAAGYWGRRGLPTDPAQVICGPGSKPLLYGLRLAIGGDVVVPSPSWVSYAAQARLAGRDPIFVPTPPGQGGVPEPELLVTAVREARRAGRDVRAVVVTLPDNPTGTIARPETMARLAAAARELDLIIVADEIYRDLIHEPLTTPAPCPSTYAPERTVITTALSKNLALGGWRIGVARLPDGELGAELRDELIGIGSEIWSSPSGPIQQAAAYAFGEPPELVEHVAASTRLHAAVVRAVADAFVTAGALVVPPQAAFYCYPDFEPRRGRLYEKYGIRTGAELSSVLLEEFGVGVLPASEFGEPDAALRLRVASSLLYGETTEQRETALAADDPLTLPWIDGALRRLRTVLAELLN